MYSSTVLYTLWMQELFRHACMTNLLVCLPTAAAAAAACTLYDTTLLWKSQFEALLFFYATIQEATSTSSVLKFVLLTSITSSISIVIVCYCTSLLFYSTSLDLLSCTQSEDDTLYCTAASDKSKEAVTFWRATATEKSGGSRETCFDRSGQDSNSKALKKIRERQRVMDPWTCSVL
jgi:hypothetical protein